MFNEAYASGLPLAGSDVALKWDSLYGFLLWLSVFFFILVVGGMTYFAIKYRARPGHRAKYITGNVAIEVIWTVFPTILLMVIFGWGYWVYNKMIRAPSDAYEVKVIAKQWSWQFVYDDGKVSSNELYVPVNKPIKLLMSSEDVLHSFFIPNFRVKQDLVPGMYSSVWFTASVPGKHQVFCAEYCGTSHSGMLATIFALDETQWNAWKHGKSIGPIAVAGQELTAEEVKQGDPKIQATVPLSEQGKKVAMTKGCIACHSPDGSKKVGPSWKGIFGNKEELSDGSSVVVDENYIRESIEYPQAKIVKGYGPVMPTFKGQISESEMVAVIEYIKSLK